MSSQRKAGAAGGERALEPPLPEAAAKQLDDVYRRPPAEFVAARNALVKRLRSSGERAAADSVKGLRRPSVAAWLVNRLGLDMPEEVGRLAELARELSEAQDEALSGGGAGALRRAAAEERDQNARLVAAARELGAELERKPGEHVYEQVAETLRAAGTDPELADQVRRGRVERERAAATLGATPTGPVSPARQRRSPASDPAAKRAKRELERLRRESEGAGRQVAEAEARVERAERELREAKADRGEAKRSAREAQKSLRGAERRAGV